MKRSYYNFLDFVAVAIHSCFFKKNTPNGRVDETYAATFDEQYSNE